MALRAGDRGRHLSEARASSSVSIWLNAMQNSFCQKKKWTGRFARTFGENRSMLNHVQTCNIETKRKKRRKTTWTKKKGNSHAVQIWRLGSEMWLNKKESNARISGRGFMAHRNCPNNEADLEKKTKQKLQKMIGKYSITFFFAILMSWTYLWSGCFFFLFGTESAAIFGYPRRGEEPLSCKIDKNRGRAISEGTQFVKKKKNLNFGETR